ncbi:hypothetical protein CHRYSEOSP005_25430 [Chryseobacterium sp. Alg-005]|uniref:AAA family ATPase n=1 Tax=Chryseobacterium sp. Alg-005 TaxID=3159516 RepID=UPI0035559A86
MSKGIRITNVRIGKEIFPISNEKIFNQEKNFYTVIIGNNASGKSRFLVNILNVFRQSLNQRLKSTNENVHIECFINGKKELITNDSFIVKDINEINLLTISNSLFDKFPHEVKTDKNYAYIGVRVKGINIHKRAIINDLMDVFNENLKDQSFIIKAKQLFDFLKIEPIIQIKLRNTFNTSLNRSDIIKYSKSVESLQLFLRDLSRQSFFRQQAKIIEKYSEDIDFLEGFINFINSNSDILVRSPKNKLHYHLEINLNKSNDKNKTFLTEYRYITLLRRLNFLTYDSIILQKGNIEFDIQDSSTGEIGMLMTFLRAIPELKPNSLIFIDEPEISLHPSWQLKYIDLLKKFLEGYSGCHVLIATHSHFILSDLKENFSSVVVLNNNNGKFSAELKKYTPFGWSPEAILYDVFGVINVRNHYFEYDLRQMLSLISKRSKDYKKINYYLRKFSQFNLTDGDPLHEIIKEAENYVKNKE